MSLSIFNYAFSRALLRRPLSLQAITGITSTLQHPRQHRPVQVSHCAASRPCSDAAATATAYEPPTAGESLAGGDVCESPSDHEEDIRRRRRPKTARTISRTRNGAKGRMLLQTYWPDMNTLLRQSGADIPEYVAGKTNLSYRDPLAAVSERGRRRKPRCIPQTSMAKLSLKQITALFIYHCNKVGDKRRPFTEPAVEDDALLDPDLTIVKSVFTEAVLWYLRRRGCTPEDVMTWAWILTAPNGRSVGSRLEAALASDRKPSLPPFLITSVLNRTNLPRTTLQALFPTIDLMSSPENTLRIEDSKTAVVLAVRLLRRLRDSWPDELPRVVDFIDRAFSTRFSEVPTWLTLTYNRFLTLFSVPTADGPYRNSQLLQRCQLALVKQMVNLNAQITREGYRAIITVQLANPKSVRESEKVRSMSRGWPPWFEERDGWIAARRKAHDDVVAAGGKVIEQMMEAGYRLMDWEKEASVLAGKDTDGSPTIPTRTFWNKERSIRWHSLQSPRIWAARVRATRTIEEAWWHFQECMSRGVPHHSVWQEMFEKAIWAEKLERRSLHEDKLKNAIKQPGYVPDRKYWHLRSKIEQRNQSVPGDGKELIHPPLNPREGIFNSEPPPNVENLFGMFLRSGLKPDSQLTALIVSQVGKTSFAVTVLQHWNKEQAERMLSPPSPTLLPFPTAHHPITPAAAAEKDPINIKVFTAFLTRLSRPRSLGKALRLIRLYRPRYRPAWNTVLEGFVNSLSPLSPVSHLREQNVRLVWCLFNEMRSLIDIDAETLRLLAIAAERWTTLGLATTWDRQSPIEMIVPVVFQHLGIEDRGLGPALVPPEPALLHAFVRALGFARRFRELEALVGWLDRTEWECVGPMARRTLVAVKVLLEGAGYGVPVIDEDGWKRLERLKPLVERRWGDVWADERECEKYLILAGLVRGRRVEDVVVESEEEDIDSELEE
jgi:hypothetical protein